MRVTSSDRARHGLALTSYRKIAAGIVLAAILPLAGAGAATTPAVSSATPHTVPGTIPIDDGYTVSQRYDANRAAHPELALPVVDAGEGRRILFDRRYKKVGTRELHVDLFLPAPAARPAQAIILIHGGGWRSGNKSNFYPLAQLLSQRGVAVAIPEFRLSPESAYPAGMMDANDAFGFVRDHAVSLGIDPARIAVGGESSGGQMAALLAFAGPSGRFAQSPDGAARPNALVDIDGVLDFTTPLALKYENAAGEASVAAQWLGGSWDRASDRWREASPVFYIGAESPPTLILSGGEDRFTAGREDVIERLRAEGVTVRHRNFPGLPHGFWLFDPYVEQVATQIEAFLKAFAAPLAPRPERQP